MGSISFQVVGDASVGTRNRTFTVPDAHINRLVAYMQADDPLMTVPQALLKWAELMMAVTKDRVRNHERTTQVVPPFDAT